MTSEEKKAFLLLKSIIFHYHGLDEEDPGGLGETDLSYGPKQERTRRGAAGGDFLRHLRGERTLERAV